MSKKSRWFLGFAIAAMLVGLTRVIPSIDVGSSVADFSKGLAAALMLGVLITWKDRRFQ